MLKKSKRFNLFLNLKKRGFFIKKVEFLDFIIFIISLFINKSKIKVQ